MRTLMLAALAGAMAAAPGHAQGAARKMGVDVVISIEQAKSIGALLAPMRGKADVTVYLTEDVEPEAEALVNLAREIERALCAEPDLHLFGAAEIVEAYAIDALPAYVARGRKTHVVVGNVSFEEVEKCDAR